MHTRPVPIAPTPSKTPVEHGNGDDDLEVIHIMPYTCQQCVRRKVKCDKALPSCSSCGKGEFECVYQAPNPPRKRKRKRNEDVHERLARYERILQERGLLPTSDDKQTHQSTQDLVSPVKTTGELVSGDGKSRYIGSSLWLNTGPVSIHEISEDEEEGQPIPPASTNLFTTDPISGALLGASQTLVHYHPSHKDAMKLWMAHVENVEPICKILHIPTTAKMIEIVSQKPSTASKADECLLFAIYHFAVFSMSDEDCMLEFKQSRIELMSKYQHAVRQALVNASWLKTTEMPIIQAYVLFLISIRTQTDPHLFWMMTGIAVRIAQRMGLHRDGEGLGLSPFDVQIRRRLFWQLLPLDGYAGQVSGTGISISPNSWDTKPPLNINDAQIYPGMTHQPEELNGASEMIYCLTKAELSNLYTRTGVETKDAGGTIQLKASGELERLIDEVESTIETKYLRYCDIINPLHFLVLGSVRSATNAVRLRNRISPLMNNTIGDAERKSLCDLALKILDTDCTLYGHPQLKRFRWKIKAVFLWDALMCVLTTLAKVGIFTPMERNSIWGKTADVYLNHPEFLDAKTAFQSAAGRLTLKAWAINPPSDSTPEPDFITTLRSQRKAKVTGTPDKTKNVTLHQECGTSVSSLNDSLFGTPDDADFDLAGDFSLFPAEWLFEDQLIGF
ncbi:fungal-specific transcription factor domain-containing protein [Trichoderma sp. SZMC 28011]